MGDMKFIRKFQILTQILAILEFQLYEVILVSILIFILVLKITIFLWNPWEGEKRPHLASYNPAPLLTETVEGEVWGRLEINGCKIRLNKNKIGKQKSDWQEANRIICPPCTENWFKSK